jgi:hypothetical protein
MTLQSRSHLLLGLCSSQLCRCGHGIFTSRTCVHSWSVFSIKIVLCSSWSIYSTFIENWHVVLSASKANCDHCFLRRQRGTASESSEPVMCRQMGRWVIGSGRLATSRMYRSFNEKHAVKLSSVSSPYFHMKCQSQPQWYFSERSMAQTVLRILIDFHTFTVHYNVNVSSKWTQPAVNLPYALPLALVPKYTPVHS